MAYSLVELIEKDNTKSITLVPTTWLAPDDKEVYWPPGRNVDEIRQNANSIPTGEWDRFKCSVRKNRIESFKEGITFEIAYQNLDSTVDEIRLILQ